MKSSLCLILGVRGYRNVAQGSHLLGPQLRKQAALSCHQPTVTAAGWAHWLSKGDPGGPSKMPGRGRYKSKVPTLGLLSPKITLVYLYLIRGCTL